jgi:ABC-type multidrug transport system permease subunit
VTTASLDRAVPDRAVEDRQPVAVQRAIDVRGLTKRYGKLEAVRGITFEVNPGEMFGLIGPDGAGKTSTFQILAGVMEATAGDANIFGRPARDMRSQTGYLTQDFSLYPDLTVAENIRYSGDLRLIPPDEIADRSLQYLKMFDMDRFADRLAGQQGNGTQAVPILTAIRLWFNPGLSSEKFFGPGIFALGLSMFPPLLAALAMAKEGELKTILQVYVSSIPAHEFLLGKIIAFMIVALAECLIMSVLLFTYFGLSFAGDPTPVLIATVLYAFCVAAFGTMVGAVIPNQAAALQAVAFGGFLLVYLFSGLIFPIANIPLGIRWISDLVWGRYYIEILRDALLQGGGWPAVWYKVLIIGAIGALFYGIAWHGMRRMQVKT